LGGIYKEEQPLLVVHCGTSGLALWFYPFGT
jgi:hypothetical protein